jgi:ligand-binding sensor domain-containing protein
MTRSIPFALALLFLVSCEKTPVNVEPDTRFDNRILDEYFVTSMDFDGGGSAWIGTFKQGLIKYSSTETTVYNSSNSILSDDWVIRDIEIDRKGNVWMAADGLLKFDGEEFTLYNTENSDIPEDIVWDIEVDSKDNIWFSSCRSKQGGLVMYDGLQWTVYTPENSHLPENLIHGIAIDSYDNVWIAAANYVDHTYLASLSNNQWKFVTEEDLGFAPYYIGNIGVNSKNEVCAAIDYSLSSFWTTDRPQVFIYKGDSTEQLKHDSIHNVRSLTVDNQDNIWCITPWGYAMYDGSEWHIDHSNFREHSVFAIEQAPDNKIWIGTGKGIHINN